MKTWNQISYIKGVIENHERFTDLKNAVKADGYDTLPISTAIITAVILPQQQFYIKSGGGLLSGIVVDWYVNEKKDELEKNEQIKKNGGK